MIDTLDKEASSKAKPEEESNTDLEVKTEIPEKKEDIGEKVGKYFLAQVNKELARAETGLDTITTEHSEGKCSYSASLICGIFLSRLSDLIRQSANCSLGQ